MAWILLLTIDPNYEPFEDWNYDTITGRSTGNNILEGECSLPEIGNPAGFGERRDELQASSYGNKRFRLLRDETGQQLGKSNFSSLKASTTSSNLKVSAKFLKWRGANTTAKGNFYMDGADCGRIGLCPLILRYFELDIADFTIVRPTRLAKDVTIRSAKFTILIIMKRR